MDVTVRTIGESKGTKRVWLEGRFLERAGFSPKTRYQVSTRQGAIVLKTEPQGLRIVSSRNRNDKCIPIVDLNNSELLSIFEGFEQVRVIFRAGEIHILPLASDSRIAERTERVRAKIHNNEPLTFGSLAHGGGVMDAALQDGFSSLLKTELSFANEIRADLVEHVLSNRPEHTKNTLFLNLPMQELAFDEYVMSKLKRVDVLSAGLPCSGASVAGRAKRGLAHAEEHPEVGHLVIAFLAIIAKVNPLVVILENVVPYFSSASMSIIRNQLSDAGYIIHEQLVSGTDFGALENRKRMVMAAVTKGIQFDFDELQKTGKSELKLGDILEDIPLDDDRWKKMEGLKQKQVRDLENNKNFTMQIFNADSESICTLTKGIQKNRSTDAKIQHPTNPELLRLPTPIEHARSKQIPEKLVQGLSATIAHELLGQSVIYGAFVAIGKLIAVALNRFAWQSKTTEFFLAA